MKLIGSALAIGALATACSLAACSAQHGSTGTAGNSNGGNNAGVIGAGGNGDLGSVTANLDLGGGVQLQSVPWTISNGTNTYTGVANIGDAQSVEWVAGGIQAGSGYTITVNTTDTAGDTCNGTSSTFGVNPGAVTQVVLAIVCSAASDAATAADVTTGSVAVDASVILQPGTNVVCPGITSLSANPAELAVGQSSQLGLATTETSTISWSVTPASGGTFSSTTSANPTFTCSTPDSQVSVTATVGLPADAGGALCVGQSFTTMTILINCESGAMTVVDAGDGGNTPPVDAGSDAGPQAPTACTSAPCNATGPNSVLCDGNTNGGVAGLATDVCTQTQALIVNRQLSGLSPSAAAALLTPSTDGTTGQVFKDNQNSASPGSASCYECMVNFSCGDDTVFGDTASECDDLATSPAALDGEPATQACLDVVNCAFAQHCDNQNPPSSCFCGSASGSACLAANAANGPCLGQEINGLDFTTGLPPATSLPNQGTCTTGSFAPGGTPPTCTEGDGTNSQKQYANKALPSGNANFMLGCLFLNCASVCSVP